MWPQHNSRRFVKNETIKKKLYKVHTTNIYIAPAMCVPDYMQWTFCGDKITRL